MFSKCLDYAVTIVLAILLLFASGMHADSPTLAPEYKLPDATHPLAIWHLSDPDFITPTNKAGWRAVDNGAAPGSDAWIDAYVDRAMLATKPIRAQGVAIWDWEGSSLGKDAQYVGQPELATKLNPTFNYKKLRKRIADEGLSLCVTVRANQRIVNGVVDQHIPENEKFDRVRTSVAFAVTELKCSWVYVDSNVRDSLPNVPNSWADGWLMPNTMWARLYKEFPAWYIPEHKDATTYLWTMPYHALNLGVLDIPMYVQRDVPRAVGFINCSAVLAQDLRDKLPQLKASMRAGNVLAIDAWFPTPENGVFAQIYQWN